MRRLVHKVIDPFLSAHARILLNRTSIPRQTVDSAQRIRSLSVQCLQQRYPDLLPERTTAETLREYEASVYSQGGEDGILLHIFSCVGVKHRTFVEFGVEDGRECNTANLAIHFGWSGLLLDGSAANVHQGRRFYDAQLGARANDVRFKQAWITAENIESLIATEGVGEAVDLLSVDIDGNDYWVWSAIDAIAPRVVVAEYNAAFGPVRSLTIPYDPTFRWQYDPIGRNRGFYYGASLTGLTALARRKGYALVGCSSSGVNAFFVRRDLMNGKVGELTPEQAFVPHYERIVRGVSTEEQFALIEHLNLVAV